MAKNNPNKKIVVLHTDTRDGYKTASLAKYNDLEDNQCHNQMNYFNLFTAGVIENCGSIVGTKEQLFEYVHELYCDYLRNNHFSGIYLITNRINNKKYIGLSNDVPKRLNSHRWAKNDNPQAIDSAIQKYGIENFIFEVLEECPEEVLSEREQYWCDEVYNCTTYAPNGYNIANTGDKHYGNPGKTISCYSFDGKRQKIFPSILAAAREINCNPHAIEQALNKNTRSSNKYLWFTGTNDTCPVAQINKHHGPYKAVSVYNSQLELLHTYETITEAANAHNTNLSRACASYNNPGLRAGGLYFVPINEKPILKLNKQPKIVHCYDKDNRIYITSYPTAADAARQLNIDSSSIGKAAKGKQYYSGSYIWSYLKFDKIPADYKNLNQQYWEQNKEID